MILDIQIIYNYNIVYMWTTSNNSYGNFATKGYQFNINTSSKTKSKMPQGLINLKNTCYISSVLQILFELIDIVNINHNSPITTAFMELRKSYHKQDYIEFKRQVEQKLDFVVGNDQQDAQQFLRGLLQTLNQQNSLVKETKKKIISFKMNQSLSVQENWVQYCNQLKQFDNSKIIDLFSGELFIELECQNKHNKYSFERLMDFSLPFPNINRCYKINEFVENYLKQEELQDVQCEKCKKKVNFKKKLKIYRPPIILVLHINRFSRNQYESVKIRNQVFFDQSFQINSGMMHQDLFKKQKVVKYQLIGFINHIGNLNSGHYIACKKIEGKWFQVNDESVKQISIKEKSNQSEYAYIFFYKRV